MSNIEQQQHHQETKSPPSIVAVATVVVVAAAAVAAAAAAFSFDAKPAPVTSPAQTNRNWIFASPPEPWSMAVAAVAVVAVASRWSSRPRHSSLRMGNVSPAVDADTWQLDGNAETAPVRIQTLRMTAQVRGQHSPTSLPLMASQCQPDHWGRAGSSLRHDFPVMQHQHFGWIFDGISSGRLNRFPATLPMIQQRTGGGFNRFVFVWFGFFFGLLIFKTDGFLSLSLSLQPACQPRREKKKEVEEERKKKKEDERRMEKNREKREKEREGRTTVKKKVYIYLFIYLFFKGGKKRGKKISPTFSIVAFLSLFNSFSFSFSLSLFLSRFCGRQ